jgi:CBS domain-containing protein
MNIADIMTRTVYTCRRDDTLDAAARTMWEHDCGCLPVVDDDGRVVSVVTDRDLCMAAYFQGRSLAHMFVTSTATRPAVVAREDRSIEQVEALMRRHQVRRVPVVDANGVPVGIVSMNDLARLSHLGGRGDGALDAQSVVDTLAAICEPGSGSVARAAE